MKCARGASLIWMVAAVVVACAGCSTPAAPVVPAEPMDQRQASTLSLASEAFHPGESIPTQYTCDGQDMSPALSWSGVPENTRALALVVDDPDAPGGVFTHWVAFNLPADARGLPENVAKTEMLANGGIQGRNDFGHVGYGGPCPPPGGPHRYRFTIYALDSPLTLPPGAEKQAVLKAAEGHILDQAELVGLYHR